MVSRYGGRKEPTMHCFVSHCGHPQPQHHAQHAPPPSLSQFRIISTNTGRPDVSFHVATAFPPQQGGGAAPPGGPQLRGLHHPHHGANPPIAPAHQQQPPPPTQTQHSGGPSGPAPTSTPPGPADMGKQGPPHLQGQPQMPQSGQMQLSFGVANQSRPNQSQPFFGGPRGPATRMPNHRGQVVNMSTNNVGQQIFPSHVPIQPMSVYSGVVPAPINASQMFVPGQMQMFPAAQQRHQGANTNYFQTSAGQQLQMMHQHQPFYQGIHSGQTQFYFPGVRGGGMAGAPGGVGPGLAGGASQPVVVPSGPPAMGQTGQVSIMPIAGSNVMGVPGLAGESGTPSGAVSNSSSSGSKQARRKYALDIVDPKTMKNVEIYESSGSSTPPRSGDSSARETPQPNSGPGQMDLIADFAARVAKAASEESSGPSASQAPFSEPSSAGAPQQIVNVNGPEHVSLNSISSSDSVLNQSDTSISKPQIVVLDDSISSSSSSWKQPKASSIGSKISSNNKSSKVDATLGKIEDHTALNLETDSLVKQEMGERSSIPLGVPSVSAKDVIASLSDLPMTASLVGQPVIGIVTVKDHSPSVLTVDPSLTPVVSANTNSPDIELVHHRPGNREQHPGLKSSTPAHSSPRRKARAPEAASVEKVTSSQNAPVATVPTVTAPVARVSSPSGMISPPSVEAKSQRENAPPVVVAVETKIATPLPTPKKSPAPEQPVQAAEEPVFVTPAPKERREEKASRGRDRSSQSKDVAEKNSEKLQGRDREKTSVPRSRENSTTVPALPSAPLTAPAAADPAPALRGSAKSAGVSLEEVVTKHQTNGEMTDASEGKASQRSKHKRSQQKKELNRKGAEKEGTEMDAFSETTSPAIPGTAESAAPSSAPVPAAPAAALSARASPSPSPSPSPTPVPASTAAASATAAPVTVATTAAASSGVPAAVSTPTFSTPSAAAAAPSSAPTSVSAPLPVPSSAPTPSIPALASITAPVSVPVSVPVAASVAPALSSPVSSNTSASTPAVPASTAPVSTSAPLTNTVLSNSIRMSDSIDIKNEDGVDGEKEDIEDKLVAARNEENSKVSAVAAISDKAPLIEQTAPAKSLAPKHVYKEDQWSPMNQDGKKKYERDFLISLKNEPLSKLKPSNLPDLEIVLKDPRPQRSLDITRGAHDNTFTPKFMSNPGSSSRGGVPPKRGSQQGKAKGGKPQGVIHLTLSAKEEVKLRETENAWKPGRMKPSEKDKDKDKDKDKEISEEDAKTEDLYKKVRGVLNKLTPQKFNTLVEQVRTLPIDNKEKLQGVINLVFDKAIDEPGFSVAYANMCKVLSNMQVPADKDENKKEEGHDTDFVNFRKLIVNRCQQEFEKNNEAELNKEQRLKEIGETKDAEKRKEMQVLLDEECRKFRMKSVGNIRFIGELFKLQMLTTNIMHRCIRQLLGDNDEESLECLCKLLTTIGKDLETKKQDLTSYFEKMKQISHKRGEITSRVRFMLQDVIELRQHKWIPRRDDGNPKTIDQINKEAEKEASEQALNSGPSSGSRYRNEDRGGDRKKNRSGEDGWSMAGRSNKNYTVDTTRLKSKVVESDTLSLGCRSTYTNWTANSKAADTTKKSSSSVYSANSFAALSEMPNEERRVSSMSGSRTGNKIVPSSSAEKERMLADYKSATEQLRPQHGHPQQSRSSSRDNAPRGVVDDVHGPASNVRLGPGSQSNEDSLRGASPDASPLPTDVAVMPDEVVKNKTMVLIDEYLNNSKESETAQGVAETFGEANINAFVLECLNNVLEKSSQTRLNIGKLMCHLIKENVVPKPVFIESFSQVVSDGDDLAIDIPKIWLYLAEFIVPLLCREVVTFAEFRSVAKKVGKLVAEVLQLLVKDMGPIWIRERWEAAGLSWTDFTKPENVDSFIKQHKLEFMIGAGAPAAPLSMEEVQKKLVQFLKPEQGDAHSFDQICDWIGANVGERVTEPQFIRALMTALCESTVLQSSNSIKLKQHDLIEHGRFFQKYIDNKEEYELQCLYAVQAFVHRLEHPQGLICSIFQVLWDNNFISSDSFTTWESSKDASAQLGKGVALKSLTSFFTALKEGDDEDEES